MSQTTYGWKYQTYFHMQSCLTGVFTPADTHCGTSNRFTNSEPQSVSLHVGNVPSSGCLWQDLIVSSVLYAEAVCNGISCTLVLNPPRVASRWHTASVRPHTFTVGGCEKYQLICLIWHYLHRLLTTESTSIPPPIGLSHFHSQNMIKC